MTTMGAWMAYGLVVSGLLTAAALLGERSARNAGRSTRWLWLGAMGGSLVVPLVAWAWTTPSAVADGAVASVLRLQPITIGATSQSATLPFDSILVAGWLAGSAAIAALVVLAALRLRRVRATWVETEVDGERVLVSADVGPAVVGIGRGRIVMPRWVLGIERDLRHLLLLHEREHLLAGDPRLLVVGLAGIVCAPWNPFIWLQFLRLRLAVEIDCDARVLRASGDARGYGSLLLEVGRHRAGGTTLAVAFGEPRRFLEERIRMIPRVLGRRRLMRAAGLGVSAAAVFLLAVCARDPMSSVDPMESAGVAEAAAVPTSETAVSDAPVFTPYTIAPELTNREEVSTALEANYPPLLREAGIGGSAIVWLLINENGDVQRSIIKNATGHDALDQAALHVANTMEFTPAMNRDQQVAVWVALPIRFTAAKGEAQGEVRMRRPATDSEYSAAASAAASRQLPRKRRSPEPAGGAMAYTVAPELMNHEAIARALASNYPPLLRDAGIGGQAMVSLSLGADGRVQDAGIAESSGYDALDQAALRVAREMQFAPALEDGGAVAARIAVPVRFNAR
ncbi:MAG: TonB family protein [Longimicrobiales bacterium]